MHGEEAPRHAPVRPRHAHLGRRRSPDASVHRNTRAPGAAIPTRIVLFGASAGGHLAMLAGSDPSRPAGVRAVVAISPPTDFVCVGAGPQPADLWLRGPVDRLRR